MSALIQKLPDFFKITSVKIKKNLRRVSLLEFQCITIVSFLQGHFYP